MKKRKKLMEIVEDNLGNCPKCGNKLKIGMGEYKGKTALGATCKKCGYFG